MQQLLCNFLTTFEYFKVLTFSQFLSRLTKSRNRKRRRRRKRRKKGKRNDRILTTTATTTTTSTRFNPDSNFNICFAINVTIFGESSPLWPKFKFFCQFRKVLFGIWQTFKTTLATFYAIEQIFIIINGQKRNDLAIWSHCFRSWQHFKLEKSYRRFRVLLSLVHLPLT